MHVKKILAVFLVLTLMVISVNLLRGKDPQVGMKIIPETKEKKVAVDYKLPELELPAIKTQSKLKDLVGKYDYTTNTKGGMLGQLFNGYGAKKEMSSSADMAVSTTSSSAETVKALSGAAFSTTNVQVEGVDEADVVKTDGKYIYQVNTQKINIIKAIPAANMEIVSTIEYTQLNSAAMQPNQNINQNIRPIELFLEENRMTVLASGRINYNANLQKSDNMTAARDMMYRPSSSVKAFVYDITDRKSPKLIKEVEFDGNYVSSRRIGSNIYLVANKYFDFNMWHQKETSILPLYRDSAVGEEYIQKTLEDIKYFPEISEPNFLNIISFDTSNVTKPAKMQSILGAGRSIYSSEKNLYVAGNGAGNKTSITKFSLDKDNVYAVAKGEISGYPINQFSMDEHNGYFRIATNYGNANGMYVLNEKLEQIGKIDEIAPTERIYSVRFMGDRAYMVTFKNTDPLFAIDMKDPENPKILGALKIPGFSNYLHPYDENHIIGFGKDTVEVEMKNSNGKVNGTNNSTTVTNSVAYQLGMKISVFDVTDLTNPKEMYVEKIGDRGTDSELLRNQKALLFDKSKNLIAFPVSINEIKDATKNDYNGMPKYGTPTFNGAYIYSFDLKKGFELKGKITHTSNEEALKSGNGHNYEKNINRIIYIGENYYTLSSGMIKATRMSDVKEIGSLKLR